MIFERVMDGWRRLAAAAERASAVLDLNTTAALIMVAISIFGAVAAFRVALAEQRAVSLERRLAYGRLEDISFRQQFLAEVLVKIGLQNMDASLKREAVDLRRTVKAFSTAGERVSDWLELHGAELMMRRNVLHRFTSLLRQLADGPETVEHKLAAASARNLSDLGFYAVVHDVPPKRAVLQFPQIERALERAHDAAPELAFCVLLFVAGLVFLTLAELRFGPAIVWWGLTGAGIACATWGTLTMMAADPNSSWFLGPLAVVFLIGAIVGARTGLFLKSSDAAHMSHPEAPEPARAPFAHLAGHHATDNWSRTIVLLIAAAVFVSALFGWLYSTSLKHAGSYALQAQEMRTQLVNQRQSTGAVVMGGAYDLAIDHLTARVMCAAATQLDMLAEDGKFLADAKLLDADRRQHCGELKKKQDNQPEVLETLDENNLVDSALWPSERLSNDILDRPGGIDELFALSDGFAELSAGWGNRAVLLLAVLTILAIVLYLFGQAYAMGKTTAGRWLIGSGGSLLVVAAALGVYAWTQPVMAPTEATAQATCREKRLDAVDAGKRVAYAANKYALGVAAYNRADNALEDAHERTSSYQLAIDDFKCATEVRPGFIPAFRKYERALGRVDSPQAGESFSSLNSKTRLAALHDTQVRELKAFTQAGMSRPLSLMGNFAFDSAMFAFADRRPDALADARTALDVITGQTSPLKSMYLQWMKPELWIQDVRSSSAVDWFNRGLAQLATGEPEMIATAYATYDKALTQTVDASPRLLASALTDLEILKAYCSNLYRDGDRCAHIVTAIDRIRPLIAAGQPSKKIQTDSPARVHDFHAEMTPSAASWSATLAHFDAKRDRLTVAWFRDETAPPVKPDPTLWLVRHAVPPLFEMHQPGDDVPLASDGTTENTINFLSNDSSCITPGKYVVELFLNGAMAGSAVVELHAHDLHVYRSRELDLNWCVPASWRAWSNDRGIHPWFADRPVRVFVMGPENASPKFGGAIATFYAPPSMGADERRAYFLHRTVQMLVSKGNRGQEGDKPREWDHAAEEDLSNRAAPFEKLTAADCSSNALSGQITYRFLTNNSDKNIVHVGLVGGDATKKSSCEILGSLSSYF